MVQTIFGPLDWGTSLGMICGGGWILIAIVGVSYMAVQERLFPPQRLGVFRLPDGREVTAVRRFPWRGREWWLRHTTDHGETNWFKIGPISERELATAEKIDGAERHWP